MSPDSSNAQRRQGNDQGGEVRRSPVSLGLESLALLLIITLSLNMVFIGPIASPAGIGSVISVAVVAVFGGLRLGRVLRSARSLTNGVIYLVVGGFMGMALANVSMGVLVQTGVIG